MLDLDAQGGAGWASTHEDLETVKEAVAYLAGFSAGKASFDEVQVDLDFVHGSRVTLRADDIRCMVQQLEWCHEATSDEHSPAARLIKSFVTLRDTKPKETKRYTCEGDAAEASYRW